MRIPVSKSNTRHDPDTWREGDNPDKSWANWFAWFPVLAVDTRDNRMKIIWLEAVQFRLFVAPIPGDSNTVYRALPTT